MVELNNSFELVNKEFEKKLIIKIWKKKWINE